MEGIFKISRKKIWELFGISTEVKELNTEGKMSAKTSAMNCCCVHRF
jgi:hypothetical protein